MMFWEGATARQGGSAFSIWLQAEGMFIGAGIHRFPKPILEAYRAAVLEKKRGEELAGIAERTERAGFPLGGRHYKRVPAGIDPAHPRASLLLHNGLTAGSSFPLPGSVHDARFAGEVAGHFRRLVPLHSWLHRLASPA